MNCLEIRSVSPPGSLSPEYEDGEANLLLHGWGLASGFFVWNLDDFGKMSAAMGRRAFVLDWMGFGLSSRVDPRVFLKTKNLNEREKVDLVRIYL